MKVSVALNLSGTNNAQVLVDADHYTTSMTGNAKFAAADVVAQVTATKTAATNLRTAVNAPISDNKTDNIKINRDILDRNLSKLASKVEDIANDPATPDANRVDIVHSAGMTLRSKTLPSKRHFTAVNGEVSGSVVLTAAGGASAHEWQYTADIANLGNRQSADTTTTAKTEITDLKRAVEYAFFHKPIIAGEKTDWEGPLFLIVV